MTALALVFLCVFFVAGSRAAQVPAAVPGQSEAAGKSLVIYLSKYGHTRAVAQEIQKVTGADVFELQFRDAYPGLYRDFSDQARAEQRIGARPAMRENIPDLKDYRTVYIGYPVWWYDMPMIFYTMLEANDFSGKTVVPFCTSGGSGFLNTIDKLRAAAPGATVLNGLHVRDNARADSVPGAVADWLKNLGLAG
ncbi:MAG: NAD(P)H-dependent oxidoreductase [Deltaproteobacteria bacterium]|jgi:flavodoxin|nr:NAD(P)H-dependent oxidoreductase [Deltaproteobacteria bacterium]